MVMSVSDNTAYIDIRSRSNIKGSIIFEMVKV